MTTHPHEDHATYSYYQGDRKPGDFQYVDSTIDFNILLDYEKAAFKKLQFVDAEAEGITDSFSDIAEVWADTQYFILRFGSELYFIDTQGFNYCRYVARMINFPPRDDF